MIEDITTLDGILDWLKESVEQKKPIPKQVWLDAAMKINTLVSDLDDEIADVDMLLHKMKSKRSRITETIRLAKKQVDLFEIPT